MHNSITNKHMKPFKCNHEIIKSRTEGIFMLGDALMCAKELLKSYAGKITLIYLDPPFCTGKKFKSGNAIAYSDCMNEAEYLCMMREVLNVAHELLSNDGSLYLHIDYRMDYKLRVMLDEIFGEENFRNEIIWSYNSGGRSKRYFSRKHDVIFFYSKTDEYYFDITATGKKRGGVRKNNMKRCVDENGTVYFSIRTNGKEYRYYETDLVYPTDVWTDISHLHQRDGERTSYPTQKPVALLKRIINASSYEGAYVCDLFSGSGTTAFVAAELGRKWIAVDKSPLALLSLKRRMFAGECDAHIYNTLHTEMPDVELFCEDKHCVAKTKDAADVVWMSSGYAENSVFRVINTGKNIITELPEVENAAVCVCDSNGNFGFYSVGSTEQEAHEQH